VQPLPSGRRALHVFWSQYALASQDGAPLSFASAHGSPTFGRATHKISLPPVRGQYAEAAQ
jgi:hypothetical protein